jgi:sulfur carrier protein
MSAAATNPVVAANGARIAIRVNDAAREVAAAATLADLVGELGLAGRKGVAVAINDSVVPRADWPAQPLAEGDRVLVIRATQGG